jgi:hypothetical protein
MVAGRDEGSRNHLVEEVREHVFSGGGIVFTPAEPSQIQLLTTRTSAEMVHGTETAGKAFVHVIRCLKLRVRDVRRILPGSHADAAHDVALGQVPFIEELAVYPTELLVADAVLAENVLVRNTGADVVEHFLEPENPGCFGDAEELFHGTNFNFYMKYIIKHINISIKNITN